MLPVVATLLVLPFALLNIPAPAIAAPVNAKLTIDYRGHGTVQGVDFHSTAAGIFAPFGRMHAVVANDPPATRPLGIVDDRLILLQVTSHTYTFDDGEIYGRGSDQFSLAILTGPDGSPILGPNGAPIPDLSQPVLAVSDVTIVGGTGVFAHSTGSFRATGTITPDGPPPAGPADPLSVSFRFRSKGIISRHSTGETEPVDFGRPAA